MNFLYPHFLWFLSLISIPIIIHLVQLRKYKTIYFSNNKLLDEALRQAKARNNLRNLILLLLRIFAIIFLVIAFSQPYKKGLISKNNQSSIITLYINNSFSMINAGESASLIDEAKSKAIALINSLPKNFRYYILTNCELNPIPLNFEEAIEKINNLQICPENKNINDILNTSVKILNSKTIAIFTDGHKRDFDYSNFLDDTLNIWLFYIKPQSYNNISIDTCYFLNPSHIKGNNDVLYVKVTNHSNEIANKIPVRIYFDDTIKIIKNINLEPEASDILQFNILHLKKGFIKCKAEILDFPITYDNSYYISYYITDKIPVCVVSENISGYLRAFFNSDSSFSYNIITPKNFNLYELKRYNFIIININSDITIDFLASLKKLILDGKTVFLFLPEKKEIANTIANFFEFNISENDTSKIFLQIPSFKMELYRGLFTKQENNIKMPWTKKCYSLRPFTGTYFYESILNYENNNFAFLKISFNSGANLYVSGIPLSEKFSNIFEHPLFVSVLHKIAQSSISEYNYTYFISNALKINIPVDSIGNDAILEITELKTKKSFIPFIKRYPDRVEIIPDISLLNEGFYEVKDKNSTAITIALNYLRDESSLKYFTEEQILELFKNKNYNLTSFNFDNVVKDNYVDEKIKDKPLWKYFFVLALLMLLSEMAVIIYWKV